MAVVEAFRIATFLCGRCHRDVTAICTVRLDHTSQQWCATCVSQARFKGIQVVRETCQRCGAQAEETSDVFWQGQYRIWCVTCVLSTEERRKREGSQSSGAHCSQSLPVTGGMPGTHYSGPPALQAPLLRQRYRLLYQVGQGGFGAVYKAEDARFENRTVAVKEMNFDARPQVAQVILDAFRREVSMLSGLSHPHLPRIYDCFSEGRRLYLVMDFIEGMSLEEHARRARGEFLPLADVLEIGFQLCDVLAYLHSQRPAIIFRDLKPANVMLRPDGNLYLIDFGIARHFKRDQAHDTIVLCSPGYAAPEQYGRGQTTPRADIYSLGATLHRLLTGNDPARTPFFFAPVSGRGDPQYAELGRLLLQIVEIDARKRPGTVAMVEQKLRRIACRQSHERRLQE